LTCCHMSLWGSSPKEVLEEALRYGGSVNGLANLRDPRTVVLLVRAKDVLGTTCRA
ncbi:UNVERIFIED_CONTAM: hypothetical protein Sradi_3143300, partial [Sesamum radiatum]